MKNDRETLLTQYLLDELPEPERLRLEEEFFTNDEAFAELTALEDELAYDYANGTLSEPQRKQYELRFLHAPSGFKRIALARAVLEKVSESRLNITTDARKTVAKEPGFLRSLAALFNLQNSGLQAGLAAACLLLLLGGSWLLYQTTRLRSQVDQLEVARAGQEQQRIQIEQLAKEERRNSEQLNTQLEKERRQRAELEQELARQKKAVGSVANSSEQAGLPPFLLSPGLSRSIDSTPRLTIPASSTQIRIELKLKRPSSYRSYQLVLQNLDGKELWQRTVTRLNFTLPAKHVPPGDYLILLKGRNADGQWVEVDEYYFSTNR